MGYKIVLDENFNWPGIIWIYSDPHFGDEKTAILSGFKSAAERAERIIKNINATIGPNDTLVCLGDLGREHEIWLPKIKECARKVLIRGNHDKQSKTHYHKFFDEVHDGPIFINRYIVLSHHPFKTDKMYINLHGHLHLSKLNNIFNINVNIDGTWYPRRLDFIIEKEAITAMNSRVTDDPEFLEEWYRDQYIFKGPRDDVYVYKGYNYDDKDKDGLIVPKDTLEIYRTAVRSIAITFFGEDFCKKIDMSGILYDPKFLNDHIYYFDNPKTVGVCILHHILKNAPDFVPKVYVNAVFKTSYSGRPISGAGGDWIEAYEFTRNGKEYYYPLDVLEIGYGGKRNLVHVREDGILSVDGKLYDVIPPETIQRVYDDKSSVMLAEEL